MSPIPGPFQHYTDKYGVSSADIALAVEDPANRVRDLDNLPRGGTQAGYGKLAARGAYAIGLMRLFGSYVECFDHQVDEIHRDYEVMLRSDLFAAAGEPEHVRSEAAIAELRPRYRVAEHVLDEDAETIAGLFRDGDTPENVRTLIRAGLMPLSSAGHYPSLILSEDDLEAAARAAQVRAFVLGPPAVQSEEQPEEQPEEQETGTGPEVSAELLERAASAARHYIRHGYTGFTMTGAGDAVAGVRADVRVEGSEATMTLRARGTRPTRVSWRSGGRGSGLHRAR